MKALRLILPISIVLFCHQSYAQLDLLDDNYILRSDTGLNYILQVKNNDTPNFNLIKIIEVVRQGSSASQYTSGRTADSNAVFIASAGADTFSGRLRYIAINNLGQRDTAFINFTRAIIPPSVRPGDANNDNVVNHFDIFPIGLMFNRRGDARHNLDTNIDFNVPKRIADWNFGVNNLNGKYADIDGNGVINQTDFNKLKLNLGKSAGTYNPRLSDSLSSNLMRLKIADTVTITNLDSGKIKIPIGLVAPSSMPSYGLGFSVSVKNKIENSQQDTFYNQYEYIQPNTKSLWKGSDVLFLEDKLSKLNHRNLAFCKTNGKNDDIDSALGVVEVIVDVILIGKVEKLNYSRLLVTVSDIALIDNNYNTIPVKPVSKYIYMRSAPSSVSNADRNLLLIYPTLIQDGLTIISEYKKPIGFTVYNALGQPVYQNTIQDRETKISTFNWSTGLYYLKLNEDEKVFKLIKQ